MKVNKIGTWLKQTVVWKWLRNTTWLQRGILFLMASCIMPFWPLGLIREDVEQRAGDSGHANTDVMEPGMSFTQTFRPSYIRLKALDFVVDYDDSQGREGRLLFELLDAKGHTLYQQEIPFDQVDKYTYHRIDLNVRLKKYHTYQYRITNLDITENMPWTIYTIDKKMHASPNRRMEFNGDVVAGKALTRYLWDAPMNYGYVLYFASFIGVIGFTLIEITGRKK